ncbi:MAG: 6,7-dimethyl-8-ribityllumazine synthase [Elusimicrobia bacterium]|nr:6,7-dimethyl-8-ribityllumazine synthase [Elusimicrobiota bacterium]
MLKIAIVVSEFNNEVTGQLFHSAQAAILEHSGAEVTDVVRVPGVFELPMAAKFLSLQKNPPDAVVCLGAIIQGQTDQNTYLAQACMTGLQMIQLETGIPIGLGVISSPSLSLAHERTRGELDRGREAAQAALKMAGLKQQYLKSSPNASLTQAGFEHLI